MASGRKHSSAKDEAGFQLKPPDYEPTQEELEADVSLPASFDEVVDALFASDRELIRHNQTQNSPGQ